MTPAQETFAANLKKHRGLLGWSQRDLADALGVDRSRVSAWENGHFSPLLRTLESIAGALGIEVWQLLRP